MVAYHRRFGSALQLLALGSLSLTCDGTVLEGMGPPDPEEVCAPPERRAARIQPNTIPTLFDLTQHLYTRMGADDAGEEPIQTAVTKGRITPENVAVLSGTVYSLAKDQRKPLPCVKISILGESDFGRTQSRADGQFELVVNGDAPYTVMFERSGYLPVQRTVMARAQRYVPTDDVVLRRQTGPETTINLEGLTEPVVAPGERIRDEDGERQAMLLFRPGTQAILRKPDGTEQFLKQITVQAGEYTNGLNGRAAMPGTMPPDMGYTYAAEFQVKGVDSRASVQFSQPVITYVDNFLGFPVGTLVPSGFYDLKQGAWVASNNGLVIKIVSIVDGVADLDTNGDGLADLPPRLAKLQIDLAERRQLATLYKPEKSLWRVPVNHFTAWDYNYMVAPPITARSPSLETGTGVGTNNRGSCANRPERVDLERWGVDLECDSRNKPVASVAIPVNGTPSTAGIYLRYANDQVDGYTAASHLIVSLGEVLAGPMKAIEASVQLNKSSLFLLKPTSYLPTPGQKLMVPWDGYDASGVKLSTATAWVRVSYVYDGDYLAINSQGLDPYADFRPVFGARPSSYIDVRLVSSQRPEFRFFKEVSASLVNVPWAGEGLGGLSVSIHHKFDRADKRLYLGDGRVLEGDNVRSQIALFADNRVKGLGRPISLVAGNVLSMPGQVLVGDAKVHKVSSITGPMALDFLGDGTGTFVRNPALALDPTMMKAASISNPAAMTLGIDDNLYFADSSNGRVRVTKMSKYFSPMMPVATVFTLAGDPNGNPSLPNDPPTNVQLQDPSGLVMGVLPGAMSDDQALFISERGGHRIRYLKLPINPDPKIFSTDDPSLWSTLRLEWIVGSGNAGSADNPKAKAGSLRQPTGMALWKGPDLKTWLFIADSGNHCIRRVDVTNLATTGSAGALESVAGDDRRGGLCGSSASGFAGDNGALSYSAQFNNPTGLAVRGDSLYIADTGNHRVRRISLTDANPRKWTISTVAGNGTPGTSCDLTSGKTYLATKDLALNSPQGLTVTTSEIFVTDLGDGSTGCVRRLFNKITAADGKGELDTIQDHANGLYYVFDPQGKQRATLNSDSSPLYSFYYDTMGRLACVYQNVDPGRTKCEDKPTPMEKRVLEVKRDMDATKVTFVSDLDPMMVGKTTQLVLLADKNLPAKLWVDTVTSGTTKWMFTPDARQSGLMSGMKKVDGSGSYDNRFMLDDQGRLKQYTGPNNKSYPVN